MARSSGKSAYQGNPHIRESRILAPGRPRMRAAGLQCLKLLLAVASPDPQTRAFPGTQVSRKIWSPKSRRPRIFGSNFLGSCLYIGEFHPLNMRSCLSQTVGPVNMQDHIIMIMMCMCIYIYSYNYVV